MGYVRMQSPRALLCKRDSDAVVTQKKQKKKVWDIVKSCIKTLNALNVCFGCAFSQSYWQSLHTQIFMLCSDPIAAKRASFFLHVNAYQNIIGEECNRLWSTALSHCR